MSGSVRSRMPLRLLLSSITGWRTTTPCIPIPGWAIAHLGSTSFPNPLRVRFDGVNSIDDDAAVRRTWTIVAEAAGFEARATDDADLVREHLASWRPRLVILDLH